MDPKPLRADPRGPFRSDQLREGDRYELSRGHAIYCAPTGGAGARGTIAGAQVLDSDPMVDSAGIDAGYALEEGTLRAPDIAVGGVPDAHGWVRGAPPPLAVEYAGTGQDEQDLQIKIQELLTHGTRFVWVVRLVGPRRVEVYAAGQPVQVLGPGRQLTAPGVLQNPVPVEALYDREAAHEATLRNLLQRQGYQDLDQVLNEGREEGREVGREEGREEGQANMLADLRLALHEAIAARGWTLSEDQQGRIEACRQVATFARWLRASGTAASVEELFENAGI